MGKICKFLEEEGAKRVNEKGYIREFHEIKGCKGLRKSLLSSNDLRGFINLGARASGQIVNT